MDSENIPGIAVALAWETSARLEAFLDAPRTLCGCEVVPLTLYKQAVLQAAESPFIVGGCTEKLDAIALVLWVLSPGFQAGNQEKMADFLSRFRQTEQVADFVLCAAEISGFFDEMMLDAPGGKGENFGSAITSTAAAYVDIFSSEYGWSDEKIMHTPLPRLWQLLRRITLRINPKAIFINHSDKVRGAWLRAQEERLHAGHPPSPGCEANEQDDDGDEEKPH